MSKEIVRELIAIKSAIDSILFRIQSEKVKKKMPVGIKRPSKRMNYDEYRLEDRLRGLQNGHKVCIVVPPQCTISNFQSAVINAGFRVYGTRGVIETNKIVNKTGNFIMATRV